MGIVWTGYTPSFPSSLNGNEEAFVLEEYWIPDSVNKPIQMDWVYNPR